MKKLLMTCMLLLVGTSSYGYTFLVNEHSKEIEIEAKIISKIAKEVIKENVSIFIPKARKEDKAVYSQYIKVVDSCEKANFIFIKYSLSKLPCKDTSTSKIFFTNNYRVLMHKQDFLGAFFWSKSRPNIAFVKKRLEKAKVSLPKSYAQFIEDF